MTLAEYIEKIYPALLEKKMKKIEQTLDTGETVKAYWVGTIIRIDIKPSEQET